MGQVEVITLSMSNEEAASVLRRLIDAFEMSRGNGKSLTTLRTLLALGKAIDLLENVQDEESKKEAIYEL